MENAHPASGSGVVNGNGVGRGHEAPVVTDGQDSSAATPAAAPADIRAELQRVFALQQAHRWTQAKTSVEERIARLQRLRHAIVAHRERLAEAVYKDFRKHATEFELTEISVVLQELQHTVAHLEDWLQPRSVPTPLQHFGTRSEVRYEARGVVLILAPWNYPFQLLVAPLIGALAAGNCVILRPSEKTAHTAAVVQDLIRSTFDEREVAIFTGGVEVADALLELPFDHIFFTGSTRIGKKVMAKAAEHLASVTLELGGKSPCIIDETANLRATAERVVWGKFVNAGQTCVSPDYVLVHEKVQDAFVEQTRQAIARFYGSTEEARKQSPDLARIIDDGAFRRLKALLEETAAEGARVEIGGQTDAQERYIAPTVLTGVSPASAIMREEIFGPILPVLTWKSVEDVHALVERFGKPLVLYAFSRREKEVEALLRNTTSGAVLVNNTLMHVGHPELPFGGVGASGQGSYHGEASIRAFSHERAVMRQGRPIGVKMFYPPYSVRTKRLLGWLQRLVG